MSAKLLGESGVAERHEGFSMNWVANNLPMEAKNAFEHYALFKQEGLGTTLPEGGDIRPAVIIGSGCSLNDAVEVLKDWKHPIICSSSHTTTLAKYGYAPTHIATPDPRCDMTEWNMPTAATDDMFDKTTFCSTPTQPIEYTKYFKGKKGWFLVFDPGKEWYLQILKTNFEWIKAILLPFTSNVSALLAIAHFLHCSPVYCVGVDFSNKRFDLWRYEKDAWQESKGMISPPEQQALTYHGLISTPAMMWSWRGFLCVARINIHKMFGKRWHIYNCSQSSTIQEEFPYVDIKKVVRHQGRGQFMLWNRKKQIERLDMGLARFNTYHLGIHNGVEAGSRIHTAGSLKDLGDQIDAVNGTLEKGKQMFNSIPPEQRAAMGDYKASRVKTIDKKATLEYLKGIHEKIGKKDDKSA